MSEIDIRTNEIEELKYIRFHDFESESYVATRLAKVAMDVVAIQEDDCYYEKSSDVRLKSAEHARNLIVAIEKAIELGWFGK